MSLGMGLFIHLINTQYLLCVRDVVGATDTKVRNLYTNGAVSIIHNGQRVETTQPMNGPTKCGRATRRKTTQL